MENDEDSGAQQRHLNRAEMSSFPCLAFFCVVGFTRPHPPTVSLSLSLRLPPSLPPPPPSSF